jgi:hypothetical protein
MKPHSGTPAQSAQEPRISTERVYAARHAAQCAALVVLWLCAAAGQPLAQAQVSVVGPSVGSALGPSVGPGTGSITPPAGPAGPAAGAPAGSSVGPATGSSPGPTTSTSNSVIGPGTNGSGTARSVPGFSIGGSLGSAGGSGADPAAANDPASTQTDALIGAGAPTNLPNPTEDRNRPPNFGPRPTKQLDALQLIGRHVLATSRVVAITPEQQALRADVNALAQELDRTIIELNTLSFPKPSKDPGNRTVVVVGKPQLLSAPAASGVLQSSVIPNETVPSASASLPDGGRGNRGSVASAGPPALSADRQARLRGHLETLRGRRDQVISAANLAAATDELAPGQALMLTGAVRAIEADTLDALDGAGAERGPKLRALRERLRVKTQRDMVLELNQLEAAGAVTNSGHGGARPGAANGVSLEPTLTTLTQHR